MKSLIRTLKEKNIGCGYLYFYIHMITEIMCFYYLSKVTNGSNIVWLVPFIYDGLAFVPQSIIGKISDKYPKIVFSLIGIIFMIVAYCLYFGPINISQYISLIILCFGNAFIHVNGAEVTLRASEGKLAHSAIFVAGGSFGVVTGKMLAKYSIHFGIIIVLALTAIPYILLAETYREKCDENSCEKFDYANKKINPWLIILLTIFVIIVRGYMGYGIPTSWNKTTLQLIILFVIMGLGKALGGILSDTYGIKKVAIFSTILAIPFLCFGDNIMIISLIGVMFFSMTMSITLAILVSILKKSPGLAFGLTTIGLFLGTAPIFFVSISNQYLNIGFIVILSLICTLILTTVLKDKEKENEGDI